MRAVVQRVDHAKVEVDGEVISQIDVGLLVLLGIADGDTVRDAEVLADKITNLRIFPDDDGRFNRSLADAQGSMLVVSQFTLYADTRRGRRPSFTSAAPPEDAEPMIDRFASLVRERGFEVGTGRFGAMMHVDLRNSGPFTVILECWDGRIV